MRLILDDRELSNLRKTVLGLVMKRNFESSGLFSPREYFEYAVGVVDEAIGVALNADDWDPGRITASASAATDPDDALQALQVWFVFMKTWRIARRDLGQVSRYNHAVKADIAPERTPQYKSAVDRAVENLDFEKALLGLTQDQRAAFSLVHFADVPIEDVARILKRSRGAVDGLLHRARAAICKTNPDENPFGENYSEPEAAVPRRKPGRPRKDQGLRSQDDEPPAAGLRVIPLASLQGDDSRRVRRLSG